MMEDKIFLLSIEEYEKYKDRIPKIRCWWWLRSPGAGADFAASVNIDGSVDGNGFVDLDYGAVRPALHLGTSNHGIGGRIMRADFPWIVIDDGLAIAEVPIGFWRFDAENNDYGTSEIRKRLIAWLDERTSKMVDLSYKEERNEE